MKRRILLLAALGAVALMGAAQAATITVTTTASSGAGSLNDAIAALNDGDTIAFNIAGVGPHYIIPPVGGFPIITKNNITIDGYTQPGSATNTSTILGANNAVIKVVLKGTDDGTDANRHFINLTAAGIAGFTDGEESILAFHGGSSGCTVRGLCFLGDWADGAGEKTPPYGFESEYGITMGGDGVSTDMHVSGCRFGLDPDNVTVGRLKDGVAYFGAGVDNLTIGVKAGPANTALARAQFNIFMGNYIAIIGNAIGPVRISGNFFNVYPNGNTDYNVNSDDGSVGHSMEAFYEQGTAVAGITIGTDGDGLNDAEERNVFGGVTAAGDHRFLEWYGGAPPSYVLAGNYFGVGVDGVTRFTNGGPTMELVETFKGPSTARFGSDFNGTSDALEGNVVSWNYPFATLFPNPAVPGFSSRFRFAKLDAGDALSVRGNQFVGMETLPFTYFGGGNLNDYSNRTAQFMVPTGDYNTFYPQMSTISSSTHLIGSCAPGLSPYDQALVIDVYKADPEGWVNGKKFGLVPLIVNGVTNGFAQGKTYVGSLRDNGPYDLDSAVGSFDFNIGPGGANLGLTTGDFVTVTANYSDTALAGTAVGATGAAVFTSNFSMPVTLQAQHGNIVLVTVADNGTNAGATGTFYNAITNAKAGDTIAFNLAGPGPHYLQIPDSGFPLIYLQPNLVVDGYSQPGAIPNSNPLSTNNNAVLKIVIDGRNGNARDMQYHHYDGTLAASDPPIDNTFMATEQSGYTSITESALLGVYRSTNVMIRGFAFLGSFTGPNGDVQKGICYAHDYYTNTSIVPNSTTNYGYYSEGSDAYGHVNGCWFGIDPTNQTIAGVAGFRIAVTGYRHRDVSGGTVGVTRRPELPNIGMTIGVKRGSANPRAQFNVMAGCEQFASFEPIRMTISGNFIGVMPDGVTGYNYLQDSPSPATYRGTPLDIGRYDDTQPMVFGTDGDGVNDADEGNLFGPLQLLPNTDQNVQLGFYNTARKPYIVAGNRFGIAVNGTVWTNSSFALVSPRLDQGTQMRVGSDFNGVSDSLEANVIYNNNDFATQYPNPTDPTYPARSLVRGQNNINAVDGWLSLRGNKLVNNFPNYNPALTANNASSGLRYLNSWSNYIFQPTGSDTMAGTTVPALSASTVTTLNGTCGPPNNSYTNLIVDVYLPDPQGQANGALFGYEFFGAPSAGVAGGWGFVQGKTHLGSFRDNGPYDSNPAVGAFSLNIAGLGLSAGTKVTVAVTYSAFARPVLAPPVVSGGNVSLSWTGGNGGPYVSAVAGAPSSGFGVQSAPSLDGPWTTTFAAGNSTTLAAGGNASYYRIVAPVSGMTTLCAPPVTLP